MRQGQKVADPEWIRSRKAGLPRATFNAGQKSKTVTIQVTGDKLPESNETFFVKLNNVSSGVTILDGEGVGTITNDDC